MNVHDNNVPIPIHSGFLCTPNYLVRSVLHMDLKTPFMMMRIGMDDMAKIIDNDFEDYLNTELYQETVYGDIYKGRGHKYYPSVLWNHINPMKEDGYAKLKEHVENFQKLMEKSQNRWVIFTCFAGYKKGHETEDMAKKIDKSVVSLLDVLRKKYPDTKIRIFIFTPNNDIKQRIISLNNPFILLISTSYTIFLWELPEQIRNLALKEIENGWKKGLEFYEKSERFLSNEGKSL